MTPRERAEALYDVRRCDELGLWDVRLAGRIIFTVETEERAHEVVSEHAAPIADAIESALAEQAAGEAERVREAVAAERADRERDHANHLDGWAACILAEDERDALDARAIARDMRADAARIRARATTPAPEPVAAERGVVEAAIDWRAFVQAPEWRERALFAAVDALAAAREEARRG